MHAFREATGLLGAVLLLASGLCTAQTTAPGPYYATPSWDQSLPTASRFIVLSNFNSEAVLDRETGLVWWRTFQTTTRTFANAQIQCAIAATGGRAGWRLPTLDEFTSLLDPVARTLPPGSPFFDIRNNLGYWTTTPYPAIGTTLRYFYAAYASTPGNAIGVPNETDQSAYTCVRGPSR